MRKALWMSRFRVPILLALLFIFVPLSFPVPLRGNAGSPQAADPAPQAASQTAPKVPVASGAFGEPLPSEEREWTIIAYFDGDNNLEGFSLRDLKELEEGYPGSKVEVIVLLDRSKEFSTAMGDWTGTRAFRLKKSAREDEIDSQLLADFGELNLGDPAVLESFIRETLRVFPAKKTALFMWDHGSGWINMANDDDAQAPTGPPTRLPSPNSGTY